MTFTIISDLHLHNFRDFNKTPDSRLINIAAAFKAAVKSAISDGSEVLFIGDLTHIPGVIPTKVARMLKRLDEFLEKHNKRVYYISGNHDQANKNVFTHESHRLITSFDHLGPMWVNLNWKSVLVNGVELVGIPYYDDVTLLSMDLEWASLLTPKSDTRILLLHQTPSFIQNTKIPADFDPNSPLFDPFTRVFCGHIHAHEVLGKVVVVGSPLHHDAADMGKKKGFLFYDAGTDELVNVPLEFPEFRTKPAGEPDPDDFNYYIEVPPISLELTKDQEFYSSNVNPEDIVRKFWQDVDGTDKESLAIGLDIVRSV